MKEGNWKREGDEKWGENVMKEKGKDKRWNIEVRSRRERRWRKEEREKKEVENDCHQSEIAWREWSMLKKDGGESIEEIRWK